MISLILRNSAETVYANPEVVWHMRGFQSKHWCWWYIAIGIGYLLLAIANTMHGAPLYATVLRVVIAIGFELLGWVQFRTGR